MDFIILMPRTGRNHRKHRPYFTDCSSCGKRGFCRKCFKCKDWVCEVCKPFVNVSDPPTICDDCQNELCGL